VGFFVSLVEEVRRVLLEHPEILVEVLTARPQILYEALAKVAPWERLATKEDVARLEGEVAALRGDVAALRGGVEVLKGDVATLKDDVAVLKSDMVGLKSDVATLKGDVATLKGDVARLESDVAGLKSDVARLEKRIGEVERRLGLRIEALGARWGVWSEEAFRAGVRELLREAGFSVERWVYFDSEGYVYGQPGEVELDVVVRDGSVFAVEITAAVKRGDLAVVRRKAELYERVAGRKVDRILIITAFIHDKNPALVEAAAGRMGIRIVKPEEAEAAGGSG
jgi:hypothetical protein